MIKTIGIIGAGQMGSGIAHVAALAGFDVRILDVNEAALNAVKGDIDRNMDRQVRRSLVSEADRTAGLRQVRIMRRSATAKS